MNKLQKERKDYNKAIIAGYKLYILTIDKTTSFTKYESMVLNERLIIKQS